MSEERPAEPDRGAVGGGVALLTALLGDLRPRRQHVRSDLVAGLPGAIARVPDGMAASVLAGVNPSHGLYASFAGPIAGGMTSSTRLMMITTTSAAALAAGSAIAPYEGAERSEAMLWLTLIAGAAMIGAALANLSRYIRFVSYSVMLGFLTGVAVNMVLGQLPDLLGGEGGSGPAIARAFHVVTHLGSVDAASAAAGGVALATLVLLARTRVAVLSSLVALIVPTLAVVLLAADSVARVEDAGRIPAGLPTPGIPDLGALHLSVVTGAFAVAALVLVQGAGVAEAVPNPDGSRSSTRRDFTAQGVANTAAGLLGGQPVGGSVGQTAVNVTAGARSRWAAIWSGIWMAVILVVFSGVVGEVAMPTLAAVLVYAGWGTIRPHEVVAVVRAGAIPTIAMFATFGSVLVLPVAQAVGVGVIASLLLQLNQESLDLRLVRLVRDDAGRVVEVPVPAAAPAGEVVVLNIYGSLFYAGARTLQRLLPAPEPNAPTDAASGPVVLLRLRGRTTLGATFLKVIGDYAQALRAAGGQLYLTGVDPDLLARWQAAGTIRQVADVRIYPATAVWSESTRAALADALERGAQVHGVVPDDAGSGDVPPLSPPGS